MLCNFCLEIKSAVVGPNWPANRTHCVAKDDLELTLLLLPPKSWDYRCKPQHSASNVVLLFHLIFVYFMEIENKPRVLSCLVSTTADIHREGGIHDTLKTKKKKNQVNLYQCAGTFPKITITWPGTKEGRFPSWVVTSSVFCSQTLELLGQISRLNEQPSLTFLLWPSDSYLYHWLPWFSSLHMTDLWDFHNKSFLYLSLSLIPTLCV